MVATVKRRSSVELVHNMRFYINRHVRNRSHSVISTCNKQEVNGIQTALFRFDQQEKNAGTPYGGGGFWVSPYAKSS